MRSLPRFQKRSRAKALAFVLLPALFFGGGGLVYESQRNARSPTIERAAPSAGTTERVDPPPPTTSDPPPPPTHTAEAPPSASAAPKKPATGTSAAGPVAEPSADPSKTGILDTTALPAGRKIIVDGRFVGTSPRRVVVRCGTRRIQIGELPVESLELPCGGEISFTD